MKRLFLKSLKSLKIDGNRDFNRVSLKRQIKMSLHQLVQVLQEVQFYTVRPQREEKEFLPR